jgi:hypothetical protein
MNNVSGNPSINQKVKNYQKGVKEQKKEKEKEKEKIRENFINNNYNNNSNKKEEKNINKIDKVEDTSDIDEDLKNDKTQDNIDILNFMKSFTTEHPLEKLDEFKEPYDLMIYTKNIINELLNYQLKFYSSLNNSICTNKKFKDLLLAYNDKYRLILKKISKSEEELRKNEIKEDLLNNNQNIENNNIKKLLPLKQQELDLYKELYMINPDKKNKEEEKYNEEQIKQIEEKKAKDANTQLLLIRVLKNIYNKFGPLNNIINKENSEENEIKNILSLSEKYNLPISEEIEKNNEVENENIKYNNKAKNNKKKK